MRFASENSRREAKRAPPRVAGRLGDLPLLLPLLLQLLLPLVLAVVTAVGTESADPATSRLQRSNSAPASSGLKGATDQASSSNLKRTGSSPQLTTWDEETPLSQRFTGKPKGLASYGGLIFKQLDRPKVPTEKALLPEPRRQRNRSNFDKENPKLGSIPEAKGLGLLKHKVAQSSPAQILQKTATSLGRTASSLGRASSSSSSSADSSSGSSSRKAADPAGRSSPEAAPKKSKLDQIKECVGACARKVVDGAKSGARVAGKALKVAGTAAMGPGNYAASARKKR
ncbi:hypothetical protein DFJ73DRAFT_918238 [Zopfochytrium polystomum]|nr:hypothetical protein DFJ73DRAFT_918238 [Zopfochytrium polystomum]